MNELESNPEKRIALFHLKEIHRAIHNNEWWFVITDVVAALTDSVDASDYLKKLRKRDPSLSDAFKGGGQLVPPLGLEFDTTGGRQLLQCWNTEGISHTPAAKWPATHAANWKGKAGAKSSRARIIWR